jgi:hypothetical protein
MIYEKISNSRCGCRSNPLCTSTRSSLITLIEPKPAWLGSACLEADMSLCGD